MSEWSNASYKHKLQRLHIITVNMIPSKHNFFKLQVQTIVKSYISSDTFCGAEGRLVATEKLQQLQYAWIAMGPLYLN